MKNALFLTICILGLSLSSCKVPSSDTSGLSATGDGWNNFSWLSSNSLKKDTTYVLKFGAEWCPPCKVLTYELPKIASQVPGGKFKLIDIDMENDTINGQSTKNLLIKLIKMNSDLASKMANGQSPFKQGVNPPWVVGVNSKFQPLFFINGYDYQKKDSEKARYINEMKKSVK